MDINKQFYLYYQTRNAQIAEYKKQGKSWIWIAQHMDLSRGYVKTLGHKLGVFGPQKKFLKVPDRKCPMCGQTVKSKMEGKARGVNHLNGSVTRG